MTTPTVVTVVGTRPEVIRLSRVIALLDSTMNHVLVHTGQNYDKQLNAVFFEELGIRRPDHYLDVDTTSLGTVLGDTLRKIEPVLADIQPDAFLVLGDTNSAVAALMAKRMQVPVYHMEAGNRSFDENVPEETNRRMVDHISDFNLAYTEHARRNLLAEGLPARRIMVTGSPIREIANHYRSEIDASDALTRLSLTPYEYFLVSAHRQENVDPPQRLADLLASLQAVHEEWGYPVLVSTHPRTRQRIEALPAFESIDGVSFHEPFGYFDYCKLQSAATCVLSDSGTISEESAIMGFRAITIRDSMERPEALDAGTIIMAGLKHENIIIAIHEILKTDPLNAECPPDYQVSDTSRRVVRFMLSTMARHHEWAALR